MPRLVALSLSLALGAITVAREGHAQRRPTVAQRVSAALARCESDAPRECVRAISALPAAQRRAPNVQSIELRARFEALEAPLEPDSAVRVEHRRR